MKNLLDKWEALVWSNALSVMKAVLGLMNAIPTVGLYGVFQAFYFTRSVSDLFTCLFVVIVGTVASTVLTISLYNATQDERYKSIRRHPVTKRVR